MRASSRVSCVIIILLCNYFCTSETYKRIENLSSSNNLNYINSTIKKVLKIGNEKISKDDNNILIILGYQCNDYNPECFYRGVVYDKNSKEKYYFKELKSKRIELVNDDKENYEIINCILDLSISNNYLQLKEYEGVKISHLQSSYYIYELNSDKQDQVLIYENLFMDDKGFLRP